MSNIAVPMFELCGPPCKKVGCTGVLTPYVTLKVPREVYHKCSVCGTEFDRTLVLRMIEEIKSMIEQARTKMDLELKPTPTPDPGPS